MVVLGIAFGSLLVHAEGSGQELFEKKCKLSHSIKGEGGKQADKGGPLDGVGSKHDRAWLEKYLRDPRAVLPDSKMPKLKYTDQELKALGVYLLSLT
jgi:nitric oxide reductase subunit C